MTENLLTLDQLFSQLEIDGIKLSDDLIESINIGDGKTLCCIGLIYISKREYAKAIPWQRLSADKNFVKGKLCLGMAYKKGEGVPINYHLSMEWFLKASHQNDLDAFYSVGLLFEQGLGVPTNKKMALEWYYRVSKYSDDIDRLNDQGYYMTRRDEAKSIADLIKETQEILEFEKERTSIIDKFKKVIIEKQKMENEIELLQEKNNSIEQELTNIKEKMILLEKRNNSLSDYSDQSNKMLELLYQANEKIVSLSEKEKREADKKIKSLRRENKETKKRMEWVEKILLQSNIISKDQLRKDDSSTSRDLA